MVTAVGYNKCKKINPCLFEVISGFSGGVSHQLSATRLLSSPEGSRHPLDTTSLGGGGWPPWVSNTAPLGGSSNTLDSYSSLHRATDGGPFFRGGSRMGSGSDGLRLRGDDRHGARGYGVWGCFRACQARIHHRIAKRKVSYFFLYPLSRKKMFDTHIN